MKKICFMLLATALLASFVNAQCIVNPSAQTTPGANPTPDNLPCVTRGVVFNETVHGQIPAYYDTLFSGYNFRFVVDSMRIDSITQLPNGIGWSKSPDVLPGGGNGCINFSGITNDPSGRYYMTAWGTAWGRMQGIVFGMPIDSPYVFSGNLNPYSPFGDYYLDVINPGSSCHVSFAVALGADTAKCYGTVVTMNPMMTNGQAPYTYQWSNTGDSLSCYNCPNPTATMTTMFYSDFSVTVTDANNNVATDTIVIITLGTDVQITAHGPTSFCEGDSVVLEASFGFLTYLWSDSVAAPKDTVKQSGTYTVIASIHGMCADTASIVVTVNNPAISNYQITANGPTSFCGGGTITLDAGAGFASYQWSHGGAQTQTITVSQTNNYSVTVSANDGCTYTDVQSVNTNSTFSGQQVCIISVDQTTGKNVIVWEKTAGFGVDSFKVFKETFSSGVYQLIGQQAFGDFSTYEDAQSNSAQQSDRYVISTVDACGESAYSAPHKTIHLSINQGVGNTWNLNWSHYEGFSFNTYNIYRATALGNFTLLNSVSSNANSYTDLNPPAGATIYYQIEAVNPAACTPTAKMDNYSGSRSNIVNTTPTGINNPPGIGLLSIYPNPANDKIQVTVSKNLLNGEMQLLDVEGRLLITNRISTYSVFMPIENFAPGVYFLHVKAKHEAITKRVVIFR